MQQVLNSLGKQARMGSKAPRIIVGYTAPYAVYVHEDLQKVHPNGQAKFLEEPARTLQSTLAAIVVAQMRSGKSLTDAMMVAAERLKVESQALCPVDTGFLKASAIAKVTP